MPGARQGSGIEGALSSSLVSDASETGARQNFAHSRISWLFKAWKVAFSQDKIRACSTALSRNRAPRCEDTKRHDFLLPRAKNLVHSLANGVIGIFMQTM